MSPSAQCVTGESRHATIRDVPDRRTFLGLLVLAFASLPVVLVPAEAQAPETSSQALVAVYGDSYSAGWPTDPEVTRRKWLGVLSEDLGFDLQNEAIGATGYVRYLGYSTFPHAATMHPPTGADVVVVFGGYNDRLLEPGAVGDAATVTYGIIRAAAPDAELLVIGLQWPYMEVIPTGGVRSQVGPVREAIRTAALAAGATFVDPIAEGWFVDRPDLIGPDGVHPTDAGHRYLAEKIRPYLAGALAEAAGSPPAS